MVNKKLVSYLPTFLDESIAFVFKVYLFIIQYALKDIEFQNIKAQIDDIKLKFKILKNKNKTFKTEMSLKVCYINDQQDIKDSRTSSLPILTKMKSLFEKQNEQVDHFAKYRYLTKNL